MNLKERIEASFSTYAAMTIQHRAIIDARDGLKPAARMAFYSQYLDKIAYPKPHKKTHRSVTSALDHFYVHGNASMEQLLARLARPITMRYPLEDAIGNMGTYTYLDNAAAPRYTEMRLGKLATSMMEGIKQETIQTWFDNYDNTEQFPSVLPSLGFYNIVNGTTGIATALASSIPQFNLREVNEAMIKLLWNPDIDFDEIYCPPDFTTKGTILNANEVKESIRVGQGKSAIIRGSIEYDAKENALYVKEVPYNVATNNIKDQIGAMFADDAPEGASYGIARFEDSSEEIVDITIWLTKGANPQRVIKNLYKYTSIQYHFPINMVMLEKGTSPKVYGWRDALNAHLEHEKEVRRRIHEFELKKIDERISIIDGIILAIANIDEVISIIRGSDSKAIAKTALIERFNFTPPQVEAILKITLSRLVNLEVQAFNNEKAQLLKDKEYHLLALEDKSVLYKEIEDGLRAVAKEFGDERRTRLMNYDYKKERQEEKIEETIKQEEVVVILTQSGKIKRISKAAFKTQRRNTKGVKSIDSAILDTISTNTIDTLMFFTSKGKMYRTLVDNIPAADGRSKGVDIATIIGLEVDEEVIAMTSLNRKSQPKYVCFITANGLVKKTELKEYMTTKKNNGIAAIKIKEDDSIANVTFLDDEDLILVTKGGYAIRFETSTISPIGRVTMGVKAIKLAADDKVLVGLPIKNKKDNIGIFISKGYGKQFSLSEIPLQGRGGKGVIVVKAANDLEVVGAVTLSENDNLLLLGKPNNLCISGADVPVIGRTSLGNIMIKDSMLKSVIKL